MADKELDYINRQHKTLFDDFNNWKPMFMDVRDFINPYIGYFEGEVANDGKRTDEEMLRTMPIKYNHILAAGMQWGITSPTRPWVKFGLPNAKAMNSDDVMLWLDQIKDTTLDILAKGGFYPENHQFYLELGCFGNAAMLIEEDAETVINCRTFTCGEYAIGLDKKKRPNQFARLIKMTPFQIVEQFGIDNVPDNIKRLYKDNQYCEYQDVKQLIVPNKNYNPDKIDTGSMKFTDYYWMNEQKEGEYLRKSGYNEFPVMIGRWQVKGADVYGTGPGIWSLGDAKQIQLMWRDMCTAAELGVKPAIQAPSDILKNGGINLLPAGANYYNPMGGSGGQISAIFEPRLNLEHATAMQQAVEECIKEHFNVKVFQLLSEMEKGTRTAREIIELSSEKMSQMGPLIERLETEYLPQVINRVLSIGFRMGVFPPPPEEIQGMEMKVEYISILSQAQKQYIITPIMDTVNTVIGIANSAQKPEILDKIDWDETVDQISNNNGVPPSILNSDEKIMAIRQARAQQEQQMIAAQQGMALAEGAKTLSGADLDSNNALSAMMGA